MAMASPAISLPDESFLRVVATHPGGRAVCAVADLAAWTTIANVGHLPVVGYNSVHSISKNDTEFFDTAGHPLCFVNHGCDPNIAFCFDDWSVVTTRDVVKGEELRFNYLTTEYTMATPFDCDCGSAKCLRRIAGFVNLPDEDQSELVERCSPYIRGKYEEGHMVKVMDTRGMRGVFAARALPAGSVIAGLSHLPIVAVNTRHTFTRNYREYFDCTGHPAMWINHACDPTLAIDFSDWSMKTVRPVAEDEQLTLNYLTSELRLAEPFDCLCGAPACHGFLAGFRALSPDAQAELVPHCSPFLQEYYLTL